MNLHSWSIDSIFKVYHLTIGESEMKKCIAILSVFAFCFSSTANAEIKKLSGLELELPL